MAKRRKNPQSGSSGTALVGWILVGGVLGTAIFYGIRAARNVSSANPLQQFSAPYGPTAGLLPGSTRTPATSSSSSGNSSNSSVPSSVPDTEI